MILPSATAPTAPQQQSVLSLILTSPDVQCTSLNISYVNNRFRVTVMRKMTWAKAYGDTPEAAIKNLWIQL